MLFDYSICSDLINLTHGSSPKNILHIGAHTGEEAKSYYVNNATSVVWFEANEDLVPELKNHISQFDLKQQIVPIALWEKNDTLKLEKHLHYYPEIVVTNEKNINVYRFDSLIATENLLICNDFNFINIDTQGSELSILKGMGDYLDNAFIKGIYLEINKEPLYKDIPLVTEIDEYLTRFKFCRLITKWTTNGWGDAFYIKKHEDLV